MFRLQRAGVAGVVIAALWTVGCADGPRDAQILGLQETIATLERENQEMKSQIGAAMAERDAARNRMVELQNMLDECRRRLSDRPVEVPTISMPQPTAQPAQTGRDGMWLESGNVAMLTLQQDILFDSGRAQLKSKSAIEEAARALTSQYAGRTVIVIGHTDNDPIRKTKNLWEDNLDLSCNRAMAVARELYRLGVPAQSVIAGGQGEYNPRKSGNSNQDKAMNRRVEIVAINRG